MKFQISKNLLIYSELILLSLSLLIIPLFESSNLYYSNISQADSQDYPVNQPPIEWIDQTEYSNDPKIKSSLIYLTNYKFGYIIDSFKLENNEILTVMVNQGIIITKFNSNNDNALRLGNYLGTPKAIYLNDNVLNLYYQPNDLNEFFWRYLKKVQIDVNNLEIISEESIFEFEGVTSGSNDLNFEIIIDPVTNKDYVVYLDRGDQQVIYLHTDIGEIPVINVEGWINQFRSIIHNSRLFTMALTSNVENYTVYYSSWSLEDKLPIVNNTIDFKRSANPSISYNPFIEWVIGLDSNLFSVISLFETIRKVGANAYSKEKLYDIYESNNFEIVSSINLKGPFELQNLNFIDSNELLASVVYSPRDQEDYFSILKYDLLNQVWNMIYLNKNYGLLSLGPFNSQIQSDNYNQADYIFVSNSFPKEISGTYTSTMESHEHELIGIVLISESIKLDISDLRFDSIRIKNSILIGLGLSASVFIFVGALLMITYYKKKQERIINSEVNK